ncbi:UNVERIFIED_CONTAM: hypothetical protein FKN15_036028 [Acipenser sinensis]
MRITFHQMCNNPAEIPEFDNLYLDMNGIIHQCSHPNDEDVHFRISEEKIFADIFHYLEVLFRIIKPMKVFFMAVDGVAPRAKMNQQRGRRFRSAKEAEDKIKKALEKGETLPTEARFDSNCITPGTGFMARLQEQLKYFVNSKISTDKSWQGVHVYLSGHETPGEGEHKIMEFIRSEKAKPDHDPNTRHCLYGLDADLIMLGLTSHEPHFCLLREEVRFGGKKSQKRITAPEETTFHLLHLSLMREYIDYEFSAVRGKISFEYDLERIIDDWVLMGFLVGNDFIPHLPHFHINHDALPLLYRTYISILPKLEGYINDNGNLNLVNFEKYLEKLSEYDREHFNEVFVDLKWFESKVGNKYLNEAADFPDDDHEDEDLFETEFRQYKRSYYMTKMGVEVVSDEFLAGQAECYVLAIQWILHYYYHGVQSWSWYYPYHYAPYLSDIRNFSKMKLLFDMGKPFLPFEQLLGVLPAASKDLLPKVYQDLMISEDSPIIEYYPLDFKTDLNGKQQEWEAVVLIPFIDEFYKKKNSVQVFQQSSRGESMMLEIMPSDEDVPRCEDVASLVLGKSVFVNWPHLEEARVVAVSDGETKFFLEEPLGEQKLYTGKTVPPTKVVYLSDKEQNTWLKEVQGISEFYNKRKGIVINETAVLLFAQLLTGRKYVLNQNGEVHLEKQWSKQIIPFVYQAVVKDIVSFDSSFSHFKTIDELFSPETTVFMLGNPYYGCMGEVLRLSNVGLNLKFNKKNEEVPGYTKKSGNEWLYSVAVEELLAEYVESHDDVFYEDDIWPGEEENGAERVHEITAWLKAHAVSSSSRASCDQQILDTLIVEKIEEELEKCKQTRSNKKVRVTVKPHLLFRPLEQHHGVIPDKDAEYHLFDRVVNVRESFSVPLGLRGTVIGIKGAEREAEVLYEVLFDKEFAGGLTIRCSPGRGYRLPPSALVNLTHGSRLENGFQKLTAIVKPQTASVSQHSTYSATAQKVQIGGLNHSPRSPFVPTQSHAKEDEFSNVWQSLQGSGNPHNPPQHWQENSNKYGSGHQSHNSVKGQQRQKQEYLDQQGYSRKFKEDVRSQQNEAQEQSSGGSERQNIRVLKRNEDYNAVSTAHPSGSVHTPSRKAPTEFEELMANLKISKGNETQPAQTKEELSNEEPLSPQSFAMKGTLMLKEMLKIDSSSSVPADKDKQTSTEAAYPANTTAHHSRRRSTKKLAAHINNPHVAGAPQHGQGSETSVQHHGPPQPPVPTVVMELSRICASLGMSQPEFGYLRTPQGMTVCQVKLSSGLLVHGPQCQSENEAKEKAALFALQRLVTMKRATGKNYETREYNNSQYVRSQKNEQAVKSEAADVAPQMTTAPPAPVASPRASLAAQEPKDKQGPSTPRQKPNPTTPGSSTKRRPRKLAVNFDAAKVSE